MTLCFKQIQIVLLSPLEPPEANVLSPVRVTLHSSGPCIIGEAVAILRLPRAYRRLPDGDFHGTVSFSGREQGPGGRGSLPCSRRRSLTHQAGGWGNFTPGQDCTRSGIVPHPGLVADVTDGWWFSPRPTCNGRICLGHGFH